MFFINTLAAIFWCIPHNSSGVHKNIDFRCRPHFCIVNIIPDMHILGIYSVCCAHLEIDAQRPIHDKTFLSAGKRPFRACGRTSPCRGGRGLFSRIVWNERIPKWSMTVKRILAHVLTRRAAGIIIDADSQNGQGR